MKKRFDSPLEIISTAITIQSLDTKELEILKSTDAGKNLESNEEDSKKVWDAVALMLECLTNIAMSSDTQNPDIVAPLTLREAKFKKLQRIAVNYGTKSKIFTRESIMCMTVINTMIIECSRNRDIVNKLLQARYLLNQIYKQ